MLISFKNYMSSLLPKLSCLECCKLNFTNAPRPIENNVRFGGTLQEKKSYQTGNSPKARCKKPPWKVIFRKGKNSGRPCLFFSTQGSAFFLPLQACWTIHCRGIRLEKISSFFVFQSQRRHWIFNGAGWGRNRPINCLHQGDSSHVLGSAGFSAVSRNLEASG